MEARRRLVQRESEELATEEDAGGANKQERCRKACHELNGKFRACAFNSLRASWQGGLRISLCGCLTNL